MPLSLCFLLLFFVENRSNKITAGMSHRQQIFIPVYADLNRENTGNYRLTWVSKLAFYAQSTITVISGRWLTWTLITYYQVINGSSSRLSPSFLTHCLPLRRHCDVFGEVAGVCLKLVLWSKDWILNNNNIFYSFQQEIKDVVRSHNEEHISIILSHETHAHIHS